MLHLYNTASRSIVPFRPANPARVTFYTCGPTVYDDAHIGNFRSFLAADVLRRFLESPLCRLVDDAPGTPDPAAPEHGSESRASRTVVHVMNITDVGHMTDDAAADGGGEDKMQAAARRLAEAKKSGRLPADAGDINPNDQRAIARFYERRFKEDARRLGLKVAIKADPQTGGDPTLMPRATEAVAGMIVVIERLIARGHAYAIGLVGRQTVYFDVRTFPAYGRLSGNTLEALRSGEGGRVQESHQAEKRHPADFLLWKGDPTHAMRWPSPWGEGYPGWHIECSAMSAMRLRSAHVLTGQGAKVLTADELADLVVNGAAGGAIIDLHSGGEDNIFPHHECEIAQSCCAFNADPASANPEQGLFAAHWFHPRFLMVEGAKMSKSKGNFFTARDLFASGHEPAAVRLELIKTHYRSNANFTEQGLRDSARMVDRWRRILDADPAPGDGDQAARDTAREAFRAAMHDDLNIAGAIGAINTWAGALDRPTRADADLLREFDGVLGVLDLERPAAATTDIGIFIPPAEPTPEITTLLESRRASRAAKDFRTSDEIRDRLAAMGYAIKDAPGGKVEVRRV